MQQTTAPSDKSDDTRETEQACPDCGSSSLQWRQRQGVDSNHLAEADPHWWCKDCGARCDAPDERPVEKRPNNGHETLKRVGFDPEQLGVSADE